MLKTLIPFLFIPFILFVGFEVKALQNSNQDSLSIQLQEYESTIKQIREKSRGDSLRRIELLRQIESLKKSDKLRQQEILNQIREIEIKDSIRNSVRKEKILKLKEITPGYPVAPFLDTLFHVYVKIGPVLPEERAASVSQKIELLYDDDTFDPEQLEIVDHESTMDVMYRDMIVTSITEWDALWFDITMDQLAKEYLAAVRTSIEQEKLDKNLQNILIRIGLVILIISICGFLLVLLGRLFNNAARWVLFRKDKLFTGLSLRGYEFLPPRRELALVLQLIRIFRWVIYIIILYVSLPLIFSIFPFTKGWAAVLFGWIWEPLMNILSGIIDYLPNLFSIAVIYIVIRYTIAAFRFLAEEIEEGNLTINGFHADWASPTFKIVRFLLYAFMFIVIFPYLPGSDSPIFQGVSVFLGILFSLGSSTAIANMVAGLVITYMRPFQVGDRVKIGEVTGDVVEKSLLVTRVKTIKNEYITVPNASILAGHTTNYTIAAGNMEGIILHTTITIGYDVPWRKVHELLIKAAEKTEGVDPDRLPFVHQTSLDDNYVAYQINAYTNDPDSMSAIKSKLHANIQDEFQEAQIEIMSPTYRAVRDGNEKTIPKK